MAANDVYFYEWNESWLTDENKFDTDYPSKLQDKGTSLAAHIINNIFELSLVDGSNDIGGELKGYDVRDRDAYQMVQLSLATELLNRKIVECYATVDGKVKFFEIGTNTSNIRSSVLYQINSGSLKSRCDKVLITGYDPPPKRYVKEKRDLLRFAKENKDPITLDPKAKDYPRYYVYGDTLGPEACDYYREGYIEYGKLDFEMRDIISTKNDWKIENIAQKIWKIEVPFYQAESTDVNFKNTTPRYMPLTGFGTLQAKNWKAKGVYMPEMCLLEKDIDPDTGIELPESDNKKFLRVSAVYIWGYRVENIKSGEKNDYSNSGATFTVDLNSMLCQPYKLSEGEDYLVRRVDEDPKSGYKIIFASNVSKTYASNFGGSEVQSDIFNVSTNSIFRDKEAQQPVSPIYPFTSIGGFLRDGSPVDTSHVYSGYLFPLNEGQSAYVLPDGSYGLPAGKLIVVYEWDNPCIQITDLRNEVTKENLERVSVDFYPVIVRDESSVQVVCTGGSAITLDPTQTVPDLDKDTVENLSQVPYIQANKLENGDINLVMPFADEDGCKVIAEFIYEKQNEIANDVTYTCSPSAEPVLGEVIDGNVINSIDYSYQDNSQYMISVHAGPMWQGMSSWNQSLYAMKTESIQEEGLVVSIDEHNMKCNVNIKRLGMMECVNVSQNIIQKGDKVQVTIQNNPVSI